MDSKRVWQRLICSDLNCISADAALTMSLERVDPAPETGPLHYSNNARTGIEKPGSNSGASIRSSAVNVRKIPGFWYTWTVTESGSSTQTMLVPAARYLPIFLCNRAALSSGDRISTARSGPNSQYRSQTISACRSSRMKATSGACTTSGAKRNPPSALRCPARLQQLSAPFRASALVAARRSIPPHPVRADCRHRAISRTPPRSSAYASSH